MRADEAVQLLLRGAAALRGLLLQHAEEPEVSLGLEDLLDALHAERADELVFEIATAHEDAVRLDPGVGEEPSLALVAESDDVSRAEQSDCVPHGMGTSEHRDVRPRQLKVFGERLERDAVARPLDEDHGGQPPMANSRSASFNEVRRSVDSDLRPMISAHDRWNVPAGKSFGLVPGTTTERGGT